MPQEYLSLPVKKKKDGAQYLRCRGKQEDGLYQAQNVFSGGVSEDFLEDPAVTKRDGTAEHTEKNHRDGHDSQSADLYQNENDVLSESSEIRTRVQKPSIRLRRLPMWP